MIDDEQLAIDGDRCDGCGLCVAHCPEGALSQEGLSLAGITGMTAARIACEFADRGREEGRVPCVNAVGLRQLASLYRAGLRRLVLRTAECETCSRADEKGLQYAVTTLNRALSQRGLPGVELVRQTAGQAPATPVPDDEPPARPQLSRRGFFRRMVGAVAEEYEDGSDTVCRAPGEYLPPARPGDLALFVPQIDANRCNGCDACIRTCQHEVLSLSSDDAAYRIRADACTGCRLCSDVCDLNAITVGECVAIGQVRVPLYEGVCRACGAHFHRPQGQDAEGSLCHVCSRVNHHRNLYQVL